MKNKSRITKMLLYNIGITIGLYIIIIVVKTFVEWRFTNPFQWIIDIPTSNEDYRIGILCIYVTYQIFLLMVTFALTGSLDAPKSIEIK